jgi:hypothetical protein
VSLNNFMLILIPLLIGCLVSAVITILDQPTVRWVVVIFTISLILSLAVWIGYSLGLGVSAILLLATVAMSIAYLSGVKRVRQTPQQHVNPQSPSAVPFTKKRWKAWLIMSLRLSFSLIAAYGAVFAAYVLGGRQAETKAQQQMNQLQTSVALSAQATTVARLQPTIDVLEKTVVEFTSRTPKAAITTPVQGEYVPRDATIRGTFEYIPANMSLWTYLLGEDGTYYCDEVALGNDGTWQADIGIGNAEDHGRSYKLGVLLADEEANTIIRQQRSFNPFLPAGVVRQENSEITIYRK